MRNRTVIAGFYDPDSAKFYPTDCLIESSFIMTIKGDRTLMRETFPHAFFGYFAMHIDCVQYHTVLSDAAED